MRNVLESVLHQLLRADSREYAIMKANMMELNRRFKADGEHACFDFRKTLAALRDQLLNEAKNPTGVEDMKVDSGAKIKRSVGEKRKRY